MSLINFSTCKFSFNLLWIQFVLTTESFGGLLFTYLIAVCFHFIDQSTGLSYLVMNFWIQQNTLFYNVIIVQLNTVRHRTGRTHSSALENLQDGCSVERIYTSLYSNLVRDEVDNVLTKSWVNALFTVLIGLLNCLTICDWPGSVHVKLSSLGITFFVCQPFWSINWLNYTVCAVLLKHSESKEMASSLFAGRLMLLSVVCFVCSFKKH